jgi:hypothetical protein
MSFLGSAAVIVGLVAVYVALGVWMIRLDEQRRRARLFAKLRADIDRVMLTIGTALLPAMRRAAEATAELAAALAAIDVTEGTK